MSSIDRRKCAVAYALLYTENTERTCEVLRETMGPDADTVISEAKRLLDEILRKYGEDRDKVLSELAEYCKDYVEYVTRRVASSSDLALLALFFAKGLFYPVSIHRVRTFIEMMGLSVDLESLLREGVILRLDEHRIVMPTFVESVISQAPCEVSIDEVIENLQQSYVTLSVLESYIDGKSPHGELFEKLYGIEYETALSSLNLHRVAKFCPEDWDLVFNPCIDLYELREKLHEFKKISARRLLRQLDVTMGYGRYSKKLGVLCHVIAFGPGVHGVILSAPWIVPTRALERYMSKIARLFVLGIPFRREFSEYFHQFLETTASFRRTAVAFIQEGAAYLVAPVDRDRVLDSLIDFLYRSGLEVLEF